MSFSEQGRHDGPLRLQRRWQRFTPAHQIARGRILAVLVAGWTMDLFRRENQDRGCIEKVFVQGIRLGRVGAAHYHGWHRQSHRAGLVAGRQVDCVHRADGRF